MALCLGVCQKKKIYGLLESLGFGRLIYINLLVCIYPLSNTKGDGRGGVYRSTKSSCQPRIDSQRYRFIAVGWGLSSNPSRRVFLNLQSLMSVLFLRDFVPLSANRPRKPSPPYGSHASREVLISLYSVCRVVSGPHITEDREVFSNSFKPMIRPRSGNGRDDI